MKKYLLLLMALLFVASVSAATWPLGKDATCSLPSINKTGLDCDIYWCNTIQEGNYSIEREICVFTDNAIISNDTSPTINQYNNSEINDFITNYTIEGNMTIKEYIIAMRDGIDSSFQNRTIALINSYTPITQGSSNSSQEWPWYAWPLILMIISLLIAFLVYTKTTEKISPSKVTQVKRNFSRGNKFVGDGDPSVVDDDDDDLEDKSKKKKK